MDKNAGKVISVRVPMADYVQFITEASENKLSVSEFMTMKLYAKPTNFERGGNIEDLEKLKKSVSELTIERDKWKSDYASRKKKFDELEAKHNLLIKDNLLNVEQLKKKLDAATNKIEAAKSKAVFNEYITEPHVNNVNVKLLIDKHLEKILDVLK